MAVNLSQIRRGIALPPPLTRILLFFCLVISITYQVTHYLFSRHPQLLDDGTTSTDAQDAQDALILRQPVMHEMLALVPQHSVFYPWVYVTATFTEQNLVTLAIAATTILYAGRYFERAWGPLELAKFVALVTIGANIVATAVYVIWFAITRDASRALTTIQGSVALQAAFIVAFKQLVPEHTVSLLNGLLRMRVKHFPAIFLLANTLSGIILGTDTALVLAWAGFLYSWTYLRFYKLQPDFSSSPSEQSSTLPPQTSFISSISALITASISSPLSSANRPRGDASDTFSFASFWPDVLQPSISAITNRLYMIFVMIKIIRPFNSDSLESGTNFQTANSFLENQHHNFPANQKPRGIQNSQHPGKARDEAERRRALALKALDERLRDVTAKQKGRGSKPELQASERDRETKELESSEGT